MVDGRTCSRPPRRSCSPCSGPAPARCPARCWGLDWGREGRWASLQRREGERETEHGAQVGGPVLPRPCCEMNAAAGWCRHSRSLARWARRAVNDDDVKCCAGCAMMHGGRTGPRRPRRPRRRPCAQSGPRRCGGREC